MLAVGTKVRRKKQVRRLSSMYREITYYTLKECVGAIWDTTFGVPPLFNFYQNEQGIQLDVLNEEHVAKLWQDYIAPAYRNYFVVAVESEDKKEAAFKDWLDSFVSLIYRTKDKYIPILKEYEAAEDKLMDDIKQTSTARFNDTPQTSGNYIDSAYTSTITTNEVSSAGSTTAVRLAEIKAAWDNIMYEWFREFHGLFMEG